MGHRIGWQPEDLSNLHHEFTHVASPMVGYGMTAEIFSGFMMGHASLHQSESSMDYLTRYIICWDDEEERFELMYKNGGITQILDIPRYLEVA